MCNVYFCSRAPKNRVLIKLSDITYDIDFIIFMEHEQSFNRLISSNKWSYPQPPNLCTEAVIDRVMITCMLAN